MSILCSFLRQCGEGGTSKKAQVPFAEFIERDEQATKSPDRLKNPHGFHRDMAQKMVGEYQAQLKGFLANTQLLARQPVVAPTFKSACTLCNDGLMPAGGYCSCEVGVLRQQIAEHQSKSAGATA